MISKDKLLHIADLSGLSFSEVEIMKFKDEFNDILEHISVISDIEADNVEPLFYLNNRLLLREDIPEQNSNCNELLSNSPQSENNYIKFESK